MLDFTPAVFNMKKLFLALLMTVAVHAEQRVVLIHAGSNTDYALRDISVLLLQGWTVETITPSHSASAAWFLLVLKK